MIVVRGETLGDGAVNGALGVAGPPTIDRDLALGYV
jgi:hypothetical protein